MTYGASPHGGGPLSAQPDAIVISTSVMGTGDVLVALVGSGTAYHGVSGAGACTLPVEANANGAYTSVAIAATGGVTLPIVASGEGAHGVAGTTTVTVPLAASGQVGHGVAGICAGAISCTAFGSGAHGVRGVASGNISLTSTGVGIHERYELRGEVREGGVLVNRRVRAYLRSSGALVGEADTVVGKFSIAAGFSLVEHYITPIDLSETAADWLPPTANRILPVLAQDTP